MCRFVVNGMGTPGVLPPFTAIGLGNPSLANAYGSGIPSLGAFALASSGALGSATPGALRGLSNVLLVSNLNEEVSEAFLCWSLENLCHKNIDIVGFGIDGFDNLLNSCKLINSCVSIPSPAKVIAAKSPPLKVFPVLLTVSF